MLSVPRQPMPLMPTTGGVPTPLPMLAPCQAFGGALPLAYQLALRVSLSPLLAIWSAPQKCFAFITGHLVSPGGFCFWTFVCHLFLLFCSRPSFWVLHPLGLSWTLFFSAVWNLSQPPFVLFLCTSLTLPHCIF